MQQFPHGDKIRGRIKKYEKDKDLMKEILQSYNILNSKCLAVNVSSEQDILQIVEYMNEYLEFFYHVKYQKLKNKSQSQLFPSLYEEFMQYLFVSLIEDPLICGSSSVPITLHVKPISNIIYSNYFEPCIYPEMTNADFVIGISKTSLYNNKISYISPFIYIENKKYADKPRRAIVKSIAEKVKNLQADCLFVLVVNYFKGNYDESYNSKHDKPIDQIFALDDENHFIRGDVVLKLFLTVQEHLKKIMNTTTLEQKFQRGYMMDDPLLETISSTTKYGRKKSKLNMPNINRQDVDFLGGSIHEAKNLNKTV
jgi:hypothetical protein